MGSNHDGAAWNLWHVRGEDQGFSILFGIAELEALMIVDCEERERVATRAGEALVMPIDDDDGSFWEEGLHEIGLLGGDVDGDESRPLLAGESGGCAAELDERGNCNAGGTRDEVRIDERFGHRMGVAYDGYELFRCTWNGWGWIAKELIGDAENLSKGVG